MSTAKRTRRSRPRSKLLKALDDPGLLGALASAAARLVGQQRFCRNCGDPFDDDTWNATLDKPSGSWRPCPNPSPGRPMVDCGIGGHMYVDSEPRSN